MKQSSNSGWLSSIIPASASHRFALLLTPPAVVALLVSSYLAYTTLMDTSLAGCGAGSVFDCGSVLKSKWSRWFTIPVSLLAAVTYVGMLGSLAFAQSGSTRRRTFLWKIVMVLGLSAGAAAVWFIFLQVFVLKHLCIYCLAAHTCGLLISLMIIAKRPFGMFAVSKTAVLALTGIAALTIGQYLGPEPATFKEVTFPIAENSPTEDLSDDLDESSSAELSVDEGESTFSGDMETDDLFGAPDDDDELIFDAPSEDDMEDDLFEAPVDDDQSDIETSHAGISLSSQFALAFHSTMLSSMIVAPQQPAFQQNQLPTNSTSQSSTPANVIQQNGLPQNSVSKNSVSKNPVSQSATPKKMESSKTQSDETKSDEKQSIKKKQSKPKKPRRVVLAGGIKLDAYSWPIIGNPQAKFVFVEMFDYACPHCRRTHQKSIQGAKQILGDDLAVIVLPLPLNQNCNNAVTQTPPMFVESCELAKLSVAVWKTDPVKFNEFHNWMLATDTTPTYFQARAYADSIVDPVRLNKAFNSKVVSDYISKHVKIYTLFGKGIVPKLMFPGTGLVGEYTSVDGLIQMINDKCIVEAPKK